MVAEVPQLPELRWGRQAAMKVGRRASLKSGTHRLEAHPTHLPGTNTDLSDSYRPPEPLTMTNSIKDEYLSEKEQIQHHEPVSSNIHAVAERGHTVTDRYGNVLVEFDKAAEKRLVRKIDLMIIPTVALIYLFCFIDVSWLRVLVMLNIADISSALISEVSIVVVGSTTLPRLTRQTPASQAWKRTSSSKDTSTISSSQSSTSAILCSKSPRISSVKSSGPPSGSPRSLWALV